MDVTAGIDIGTTSIKGVAVDAAGSVVARVRRPHEVVATSADRFEHDAAAVWHHGLREVWDALQGAGNILGVTVAAMVPSLTAVDGDGLPLGPGLLYGDGRGAGVAGSPSESGELVGFLRWLAQEYPDAAGFWPAQAVANAALTGTGAIDTSTAMTTLPLFDGEGWDARVCAHVGIDPTRLPNLSLGSTSIGEVGGAAVSGGTIDALAEQIVAGADAIGDVLVICGTTLITWAVTDEWRDVDGLWTVPSSAPGLAAIGGASNAGGLFVDRVRRLVGDVDTGTVAPGAVPVWLPYIRGERTPLHDTGIRAQLLDLDVSHGPAEVLRAAYEAAGFVVRHHLDLADTRPTRIVATGGGTNSGLWMQSLADATGLPVDVAAEPEGAAIGAAYMSRVTAGLEDDLSGAAGWARSAGRVEPDPEWVAAMEGRYRRFREATASR